MALRRFRAAVRIVCLIALVAVPRVLVAQNLGCTQPGDVEVRRLDFAGNKAFSRADLLNSIVTTPSDFLRRHARFLGLKRCLDPVEFQRDRVRLILFYLQHGYPNVTVDTSVRRASRSSVDIRFLINEGRAILIDSFAVRGLELVEGKERILAGLPIRLGGPFDTDLLAAAKELIRGRLHDSGYPRADVLHETSSDKVRFRASVTLTVVTGRFAKLHAIRVLPATADGKKPSFSEEDLRKLLNLKPGEMYSESQLNTAQQNLYQTRAFQHVAIRLDSVQPPGDSLINIEVQVVELGVRTAHTGFGWGSVDCFRAQGDYTDRHLTLFGRNERMELNATVSKLQFARDARGLNQLCTNDVRKDRFSRPVNYYVGATFSQPAVLGVRRLPTVSIFSERRSEFQVYRQTTRIGGTMSYDRSGTRLRGVFGYELRRAKREAEPAVFCAVFNICNVDELLRLQDYKTLGAVSASFTRDRSRNPANALRGTLTRLDVRHANRFLLSDRDLQFTKVLGDTRGEIALAKTLGSRGYGVLAGRLLMGGVFGQSFKLDVRQNFATSFVPPDERVYAGGPTTVRGFRQNELGPAVYVVGAISDSTCYTASDLQTTTACADPPPGPAATYFPRTYEDTNATRYVAVPTGGNAMLVAQLEYRFHSPFLPSLLEWALFTDVGRIWNLGTEPLKLAPLKWTPGLGVRVLTFVGALRLDVGYNPHPRPSGPAYFGRPADLPGGTAPLYCVSPGNRLVVERDASNAFFKQSTADRCESTFTPKAKQRFGRLNFNFSIGQAF